jgi:hypothetical protein
VVAFSNESTDTSRLAVESMALRFTLTPKIYWDCVMCLKKFPSLVFFSSVSAFLASCGSGGCSGTDDATGNNGAAPFALRPALNIDHF